MKYFLTISGAVPPNNMNKMSTFATVVNPFPCPTCPRSYMSKYALQKHLRFQCGMEPQFKCPFCPHRTYLKENMKVHFKCKHKNEMVNHIF